MATISTSSPLYKPLKTYYGIKPIQVESVGTMYRQLAVFKVQTKKRCYCVKPFQYNNERFRFYASVLHELRKHGYQHAPNIIKTKAGHNSFTFRHKRYVVSDWYQGRPCNFENHQERKKTTHAIAKLHRVSKKILRKHPKFKGLSKQSIRKLIQHHRHFQTQMTQFEHDAIDHANWIAIQTIADSLDRDGKRAVSILRTYLRTRTYLRHETICHNDLTVPNCLIDQRGFVHIIDFDSCLVGNRILDLASYLSNTMNWSWESVKASIQTYGTLLPWTKETLQVLYACMLVPREAWFIVGNWSRAYKKHRSDAFERNEKLLTHILATYENKTRCLEHLAAYIENVQN